MKDEIIYQEGSETLRKMPENYLLASFEKGHWVVDVDGAISESLHIALVRHFHKLKNKFQKDSWKTFDLHSPKSRIFENLKVFRARIELGTIKCREKDVELLDSIL